MTESLYIDGFNLLHRLHDNASKVSGDLKGLVYRVESYVSTKGVNATIVFDGSRFKDELLSCKVLKAVFSKPKETADEVLGRLMTAIPPNERIQSVLVTDDGALRSVATGLGLRVRNSAAFIAEMQSADKAKAKQQGSTVRTPFNTPFADYFDKQKQ